MGQAKCCKIGCTKDAAFEISENTREDPDNFTHSCEEHLGEMTGTTEGFPACDEWTVLALIKD